MAIWRYFIRNLLIIFRFNMFRLIMKHFLRIEEIVFVFLFLLNTFHYFVKIISKLLSLAVFIVKELKPIEPVKGGPFKQ
jgi:hypothetical protein